jgi:predicted phosphodiesterase
MRKILQYLLKRPLTWIANNLSAAPQKKDVFRSLSKLYKSSSRNNTRRITVIEFNSTSDNFIVFSDQHKGNKDNADDFNKCEPNYIAALQYYHAQCFNYINLGDCEELWKYKPEAVLPHVGAALQAEAAFQPDKRYYRTFGNHDIIWKNKWDVERLLKNNFSMPLPVTEGVLLKTTVGQQPLSIFLTHGHQGDKMSDNNAFSTWVVAHCWTPLQRYLQINVNTPSKDDNLRNKHNKLMYEWSCSKKNLLLITGHTHLPVFASGKYSSHPANAIEIENTNIKPTYFNSGCCCFSDGDITGIELAEGSIRLIRWKQEASGPSKTVLEEIALSKLVKDLD